MTRTWWTEVIFRKIFFSLFFLFFLFRKLEIIFASRCSDEFNTCTCAAISISNRDSGIFADCETAEYEKNAMLGNRSMNVLCHSSTGQNKEQQNDDKNTRKRVQLEFLFAGLAVTMGVIGRDFQLNDYSLKIFKCLLTWNVNRFVVETLKKHEQRQRH